MHCYDLQTRQWHSFEPVSAYLPLPKTECPNSVNLQRWPSLFVGFLVQKLILNIMRHPIQIFIFQFKYSFSFPKKFSHILYPWNNAIPFLLVLWGILKAFSRSTVGDAIFHVISLSNNKNIYIPIIISFKKYNKVL